MPEVILPKSLVEEPSWYKKMYEKWEDAAANVFIFHRNVSDYVDGRVSLVEYLLNKPPLDTMPIVVTYDLGYGIGFQRPQHCKNFCSEMGLSAAEIGDSGEFLPKDPVGALTLLSRLLLLNENGEKKAGVIIKNAEALFPNNSVSQMSVEDRAAKVMVQNWAHDSRIINYGNPVYLLTENISDIHESLRTTFSRIAPIEVPNPSLERIKAYMDMQAQVLKVKLDIEPKRIPHLTAGLGLIHIEDIIHRASYENKAVTAELFTQYKDEIMATEFDGVLEIIEPGAREQNLGGMHAVRKVIEKCIAEPMLTGNFKMAPMGVILMGPPGCGKTALMMSVATKVDVSVVNFNINAIFDKYVGGSEAKLDRALKTIESIGQCIVIMDEISESGIGRDQSGDSGVGTRIFRRILEFTSNPKHRGKIVFVGMTNRPDLIDPALFRDGRLGDKKVPILAPDNFEREEIIEVILEEMEVTHEIKDFSFIVEATENFTGANLNKLVRTAMEIAQDRKGKAVSEEDFKQALDSYKPLVTNDVQAMVDMAIRYCDDKRLLPQQYHKMWEDQRKKKTGADIPVTPITRQKRA